MIVSPPNHFSKQNSLEFCNISQEYSERVRELQEGEGQRASRISREIVAITIRASRGRRPKRIKIHMLSTQTD